MGGFLAAFGRAIKGAGKDFAAQGKKWKEPGFARKQNKKAASPSGLATPPLPAAAKIGDITRDVSNNNGKKKKPPDTGMMN